MSLAVVEQADFSGGIYRASDPQVAPPTTVYDATNALLDDLGSIYRRGGTTYKTNTDTNSLAGVVHADFGAGSRTVLWSTSGTSMWVLDSDDATPLNIPGTLQRPAEFARPALLLDLLVLPSDSGTELTFYGGSRTTASYSTGTLSVTAGSRTVTGSGTSWLANVTAGMLLYVTGQTRVLVVESVQSDTSLTLRDGWAGTTAAGATYSIDQARSLAPVGVPLTGRQYVTTVGTLPRLIVAQGSTVYFSDAGDPFEFRSGTNNYSIGRGLSIRGVSSVRDSVVVFTTDGVFTISDMNYDAVDDFGNVNHVVSQINRDVVLWGDAGLVGYHGGLVFPAMDDVYSLGQDGSLQSLGEAIRPLYQSHVAAGHYPGLATTYRNHYLLPIMTDGISGPTVVDLLVCRLDNGRWTRWADHAACGGFAARVRSGVQSVVGFNGNRLVNIDPCFTGQAGSDADGTTHSLSVTTRDYLVRRQSESLWKYARLRYELTGGSSTIEASKAVGPAGSSFTAIDPVEGTAGTDDGTHPADWLVDERSQAVRLKFDTNGAATNARLRSLELHVRQGNKR